MLKQGIILIATGAPGYGNMAYNLALTIKAQEDIPIALVYDSTALGHLSHDQLKVFNRFIPLSENMPTGFGLKLYLDQLTPFERTLFLDADMLWLGKKPSDLFNELQGTPFAIITEGDSDAVNNKYYFWAELSDIQKAYNIDYVPQTRSEVIYFEKGTKVFAAARKLRPQSKLKTIRMFGEHIPDELYFNISLGQLRVKPHVQNWKPAYWSRINGEYMPPLAELHKNYYLLSFGSNVASPVMIKTYDNIMKVVTYKLRLPYLFRLKSKKLWAPGRLKI
jgi:hypothetical protein